MSPGKIRGSWNVWLIFYWLILGAFFAHLYFDLGEEMARSPDKFYNGVVLVAGLLSGISIGFIFTWLLGRAVSIFIATGTYFWSAILDQAPWDMDYRPHEAIGYAKFTAGFCIACLVFHLMAGLILKAIGHYSPLEDKRG